MNFPCSSWQLLAPQTFSGHPVALSIASLSEAVPGRWRPTAVASTLPRRSHYIP